MTTIAFAHAISRLLLAMIVVGAAMVAVAVPADAHAVLQSTSPGDGDQLSKVPGQVTLHFNEPISTPPGGIRVYDSAGKRIDRGDPGRGNAADQVRVGLPPELPVGTYIVTWRIVSADGHPLKGAFVFSVGAADQVDDSVITQVFSGEDERPFAVAATAARWLAYLGTLLAAGAVAFLVWVLPVDAADRGRLARIGAGGGVLGICALALGVPLQTAQATGEGFGAFVRAELLGDTIFSSVGLAVGVGLLGLLGVVVALRDPVASWFAPAGLAAALVSLGSLLLAGHTRTVEPVWLMMLADAVHVATGAAWFAGLVLLAVALRRRRFFDDPVGAAGLVSRFSLLATVSIAGVTLAGMSMSWVLVRAPRALTSTAYGWTLVAKVAIAAVVMAVGAYNHRRLVPAVRRALTGPETQPTPVPAGGATDEPPASPGEQRVDWEDAAPRAWRRLGRTVRWEVAGLVAVLGVTSALVYLQPASEAAGITGIYSTYVDIGRDQELNLVVDPNRAGRNDIHLYLLDYTGRPAQAEQLTLELSLPDKDIGPISRTPDAAGPGHWVYTGSDLSIPGRWEITVLVRASEFEQLRTTVPVTVNP